MVLFREAIAYNNDNRSVAKSLYDGLPLVHDQTKDVGRVTILYFLNQLALDWNRTQ
jgi:hypothetical protein